MGAVDGGWQPVHHVTECWECPVCHDNFNDKADCAEGLTYVPQAPPWLKVGAWVKTKSSAYGGVISTVEILNVGRWPKGHAHTMEITMRTPSGVGYYRISKGRDESGQLEPL